jgi:hypothetical protein
MTHDDKAILLKSFCLTRHFVEGYFVSCKKNAKKPLREDMTYKDDFQSFLRPIQKFVNSCFRVPYSASKFAIRKAVIFLKIFSLQHCFMSRV